MTKTYERCECGEWSGVPCEGRGDLVTVEYVPEWQRVTAVAAGGDRSRMAQRLRVTQTCAEHMIDCDGEWVREV